MERLTFVDADPRHETDPIAIAERGGFRVKIVRDVGPGNPWEEWDCEPPLAVASYGYGGRSDVTCYDSAGGAGLLDPFARFSDALLRRHMKAIARALDIDPAEGLRRATVRRGAGDAPDRFEKETLAIHQHRREAFLTIATAEPERCIVIDASHDPEEVEGIVTAAVFAALEAKMPARQAAPA